MNKTYPAVFHFEEGGYWAEFPDLLGCQTEGETIEEVSQNASEALGLYLSSLKNRDILFAIPSNPKNIEIDDNSFIALVTVDIDKYLDTQAVSVTVTLPKWMKEKAKQHNINLSQSLQKSLEEQLVY